MSNDQNQKQDPIIMEEALELREVDSQAQELFEQLMAAPDFEETPTLLVDTDPERAIQRQKEGKKRKKKKEWASRCRSWI